MRIAIILEAVFPENKGGLERWYQKVSKFLVDAGHEVVYLNSRNINEARNGVSYESVGQSNWSYVAGGSRSKLQAFRFAMSVRKWLKRNKVDVIYMSSVPILTIFATSFHRKSHRTPVAVEWFEIWSFNYWRSYAGNISGTVGWCLQTLSLNFGQKIVVYTNLMANRAEKIRRKHDSVVLMPGICSDEVNTSNFTKQFRENVIFIGRLVEEKQPILAIKAIESFISKGWGGDFYIVGTGPLAIVVKQYVVDSIYSKKIHFLENADDDVVEKLLLESFVILHPSRREGYGLVLVEAAYAGVANILIKYPENASTELGINPSLICADDKIETIVEQLNTAYTNQLSLRRITEEWVRNASTSRTYKESCLTLEYVLKKLNN